MEADKHRIDCVSMWCSPPLNGLHFLLLSVNWLCTSSIYPCYAQVFPNCHSPEVLLQVSEHKVTQIIKQGCPTQSDVSPNPACFQPYNAMSCSHLVFQVARHLEFESSWKQLTTCQDMGLMMDWFAHPWSRVCGCCTMSGVLCWSLISQSTRAFPLDIFPPLFGQGCWQNQ